MVIINEDSRQELVAKSRRSEKGLQRYKKRLKSRILSSVKAGQKGHKRRHSGVPHA